jgi:hypothetical protein
MTPEQFAAILARYLGPVKEPDPQDLEEINPPPPPVDFMT